MNKKDFDNEMTLRDHITLDETKNIFIEAGAGAGKSTSLVGRIYDQLMKGKVSAKNIYAITFTNKATEELRVKIANKFQNFKDRTPEEIEKQKKLLMEVDNIHISTIHKFCGDILKENAVKAGLSPDFAPAVDEDERDIFKKVISQYFRRFKHWDVFTKYEEALGLTKGAIKDKIVGIFYSFLSTADRLSYDQIYKCDNVQSVATTSLKNKYIEFLNALDAFSSAQKAMNVDFTFKKAIEDTGYANGQKPEEREETLKAVMKLPEGDCWMSWLSTTVFNRPKKDLKEAAQLALNPFINNILETKNNIDIMFVRECIKYAFELYEEYCEERDKDVDDVVNNDLIYRTYKLLSNDKDVLAKVRQKVSRLFIDEYQDTDSMQYKIASLISEGKDDCLYIVGDPKQSIYRFRGAEPDVFFETRELFEKYTKNHAVFDLNINFRSNSKIVEWVNSRYTNIQLIEPSLGYTYKPMMNHPKNTISDSDYANNDNLLGFYRYNYFKPEDIKDLILYIKNNKKVREDGKYRDVQFKDIMVLMETHDKMPMYVEEFSKNNIPAQVYGESLFINTLALRSFINLYTSLLVDDKRSMASAESVFISLYPSLYKDKTISEVRETTKGLVNSLRKKTNKMNAYGKAIYLIEHISNLLKSGHVYQDFEVNFAYSKLYQMVETVFSKGYFNGNELITEFNEFYKKQIERESLIQEDIDAVMIINLHKAKGLEKPIVIWVSTGDRKTRGSNISSAYKKHVLYPADICNVVRKNSALAHEVNNLKNDEEYEEARKEYVAVTRAGEAFIFADTEKNVGLFHNPNRDYGIRKEDDVRQISIPEKEEVKEEIQIEEETEPTKPVNHELEENATKETAKYEDKEHSYVSDSSSVKSISPSSLELPSSPTRDALRKEAGESVTSNRPKSNDVGTILHRALEVLVKYKLTVEEAVKQSLEENKDLIPANDNGEYEKFFVTAVKAFNKWFNRSGYALYPEFKFSYLKDGVINNGAIDLLMINGDEYTIIDYKSDEAEYIKDDDVFEQTLREKYDPQLKSYEDVVSTLFKTNKIKKKIIYFRRYDDVSGSIDVKCLDL